MDSEDLGEITRALASLSDPVSALTILVARSPLAMQVYSGDGRALYANAAFRRLFGDAGAGEAFERQLSAAFSGETVELPVVRHPSGRAVRAHALPSRNRDGAVELVLATFTNVLEIGGIGSFVAGVDPSSPVVWSDEACRVFGVAPEDGHHTVERFLEIVHPEDRERLQNARVRAVERSEPLDVEYRIVRADGEVRWVHARAEPAPGPEAKLMGVVQDVTERKRGEHRLRTMFDSSLDAIVEMDGRGLVTAWNPRAAEVFGYSTAEALGHPVAELIVPESHRDAHNQGITRYLSTRKPGLLGRRVELPALRKDRTEIPIELTVVETEAGRTPRFTAFIRDRSRQELLEQQLRQAQKMEAIGRLAGGIAHDFNNLLAVILSFSSLANEGDSESEDLRSIRDAAERAAALTQQLLAFSRRQVLEPRVTDLNRVVRGIGRMLGRLVGEDVELSVLTGANLDSVFADPAQVEQVIMNLVVNGRDAMPKGGKLTIETQNVVLDKRYAKRHVGVKPGPHVMLAVTDTGIGMDEATRARIFEPFFTTKSMGRGTGLGLATVYGIVRQSGGHIWVYSEPGKGTTFKVYLPVHRGAETTDAPAPARVTGGSETVLVVEDDDLVRRAARTILRRRGYSVLEASRGAAALELAAAHEGPIHLLLTDVVMPQMNGKELAERMSSVRPKTKVLYMSGYTDNTVVHHGILEPGIAFLQKPFTPDKLALRVREVLDGD